VIGSFVGLRLGELSDDHQNFSPFSIRYGPFGVGDGDETNDAAVAAIPVPREKREGAALAGDLVDVAADVLDAEDAVLEQDAVDRLPLRKVILPVAALPTTSCIPRRGADAAGRCVAGPIAVASGWSLAWVSWPTTFTCFSTNHSPAEDTKPGARQK
jgi:hypothetical protein